MPKRPVHLLVSALGWVGFNVVMLWAIAFLADAVLPRTVDSPHRVATAPAVAVDLALLVLFAAQHSVMARRSVKAWLRRWLPAPLERTAYVLATDACLALLFLLWEPFGGRVWHVGGAAAVVLWSLCAAGWALALAATYAVDQPALMGLRQAGWGRPPEPAEALETGGMYAVVRHPLMTGLLLAFWATPSMGASHLLFALAASRLRRGGRRLRGARPAPLLRGGLRGVRRAGAVGAARGCGCGRRVRPDAPEAADQVRVEDPDRLHEGVHRGRADEGEAPLLQRLGERQRLRGGRLHLLGRRRRRRLLGREGQHERLQAPLVSRARPWPAR